jgi:hypothetical protein
MPNRPKNKNCPITMKFGDIVGRAFIKMYNFFWQNNLTGKVLFGGFCGIIGSACH